MAKAYYASSIRDFLNSTPITVHGHILIQDEMRATTEQKNVWRDEIAILQDQLRSLPGEGSIIFEYTVPRIGSRIDVVCIIRGIIFVLEFKGNDTEYHPEDEEQVIDYALDLKYFHEESEKRYIVPMKDRNGRLYYVFDEDAAEELLDFQDTFSDCMDTLIETLENLKDAVLSIDVPNIEPFPESELLFEPKPEQFLEPETDSLQNELPF